MLITSSDVRDLMIIHASLKTKQQGKYYKTRKVDVKLRIFSNLTLSKFLTKITSIQVVFLEAPSQNEMYLWIKLSVREATHSSGEMCNGHISNKISKCSH